MILLLTIVLCTRASLSDGASPETRPETNLCEREIAGAAARHDVPLEILYGIGLTETGRGDGLRPFALNIAGESVYDLDRTNALARFFAARKRGIRSIDVGCMQINYRYHGMKFDSVEAMFDPAKNVDYAAQFLKKLYDREGHWTRAVARYHAGAANKAAQKRYVCGVIKRLSAAGLGAATSESRALCAPQTAPVRKNGGWQTSVIKGASK